MRKDVQGVAWSCVVDDVPSIWAGIRQWIDTAIGVAGIDPRSLHIHHVCPLPSWLSAYCRSLGVQTHPTEPFDRRFPHANKIAQCFTAFGSVGKVVLMDVDTVFATRPPVERIQAPLAGKLVDLPNPPVDTLRRIFSAAGITAPQTKTCTCRDAEGRVVSFETFPGNFNGGVYVIDRERIVRIGEDWLRWARWLVDHVELMERWSFHIDQIAFCLAAQASGTEMELLDAAWNFPLHLPIVSAVQTPIILHHHGLITHQPEVIRTAWNRPGEQDEAIIRRIRQALVDRPLPAEP